MRGGRVPWATLLLALLLLPPVASAQSHENFARASTDLEALRELGATLLNNTETALSATLAADDANASRRARLGDALTADLGLIASLADVDSALHLAPLVSPYTHLARNATNVTKSFAAARLGEDAKLAPIVRVQVAGMGADADNFDLLGFDTTRLRQLLVQLEGAAAKIEFDRLGELPEAPYVLLVAEPAAVALGDPVTFRGVVSPARADLQVRLRVDGAPWNAVPTGTHGGFSAQYVVPRDARVGTHTVEAEVLAPSGVLRANATFRVDRMVPLLTLTSDRPVYAPDEAVVLRARLLDADRAPIRDAQGALSVGDAAAENVTFLSDGSLVVRIPAGTLANGTHAATLTYGGDASHEPASASATWRIGVLATPPPPKPEPTLAERAVDLGIERLVWPGAIALVLLVEVLAARALASPAPGAPTARERRALDRLAPVPARLAVDDPRRVVLLAYRDVLLALSREGVPIDRLTHLEIADALERRGRDAHTVRAVTDLFERVRYGGAAPPEGALREYLPMVVRLLRGGGARLGSA